MNRQVVERTVIFPADHLGTFDRADFLEAAVLFENLSQRLQLGNVLRPLPFRAPEAFFELTFQSFEVEVVFREVVNRSVSFGFDLHVVEVRVHGGRDVAGQSPGSRRPDEQKFVFDRLCATGSASAIVAILKGTGRASGTLLPNREPDED